MPVREPTTFFFFFAVDVSYINSRHLESCRDLFTAVDLETSKFNCVFHFELLQFDASAGQECTIAIETAAKICDFFCFFPHALVQLLIVSNEPQFRG